MSDTPKVRSEFIASWKDWEGAVCVTLDAYKQVCSQRDEARRELAEALANLVVEKSRSIDLALDLEKAKAALSRQPSDMVPVPRDVLQDIACQFRDASNDVAHWGDYAGAYFQMKYQYENDIKRYREQEDKVRAMLAAAGREKP